MKMNTDNLLMGLPKIHTTDRNLFRRCRRKWNWSSPLRQGLVGTGETPSALWFGIGIHFALEDFHGYQQWGHPVGAFRAFLEAYPEDKLPVDWEELEVLACEILTYYAEVWHGIYFKQYRTAIGADIEYARHMHGIITTKFVDVNMPLVETKFQIPLFNTFNKEVAWYVGTFDRIVIDPFGRFWVVDYKTTRAIDTAKLENDPQASAYTWAATRYFGVPFEGVIWVNISKDVPSGPKRLVNGEFSQDKRQKTTYRLYSQALMDTFSYIPQQYVDFLNYLAIKETENGDAFIRYDLLRRNKSFVDAESAKIMYEVEEMLRPHLAIYPNPTRDCAWDCPFRSACISYDDGSDFQYILDNEFIATGTGRDDSWRENVAWPKVPILHTRD